LRHRLACEVQETSSRAAQTRDDYGASLGHIEFRDILRILEHSCSSARPPRIKDADCAQVMEFPGHIDPLFEVFKQRAAFR